jgi:translation initiation factor 1
MAQSPTKPTSRNSLSDLASLGGLVYSTDVGKTCPGCRHAVADCQCQVSDALVGAGEVRVMLERRRGKLVTVVSGLAVTVDDCAALGKRLRQVLGSGGTVKEGVIEIQGDHVTRAAAWLKESGHRIKVPKT